jgi:hypothetical protein
MVNHGPSVALRGQTFQWTIGTANLNATLGLIVSAEPRGILVNPGGFSGCTHGILSSPGYDVDCELARPLQAGERIHVQILFPYDLKSLPQGSVHLTWRTTWSFQGVNDPTPQDNSGMATHGICRPSSNCTP